MDPNNYSTDEYLICKDNTRLYFVRKNAQTYQGKIILLYGETFSGKSTILKEILYLLHDKVSVPVVFSPTNFSDTDGDFNAIVPNELIYGDIDVGRLQDIWDAQEERVVKFKLANSLAILKSLFDMVATSDEGRELRYIVSAANSAIDHVKTDNKINPGLKRGETIHIKKTRDDKLSILFKKYIRIAKNQFNLRELDHEQKIALKYLDFNPKMILIFDDCMSTSSSWKKEEIIRKLYYQGRKLYITQIWTLQDDKNIPPDLRKNAMISIFTSPNVAHTYFANSSNGVLGHKKKSTLVIDRVFREQRNSPPHYQKLFFDKNAYDAFKVTIANIHEDDFKVGSHYVWKFTESTIKKASKRKIIPRSSYLE